jgi:hypothetical protein
MGKRSKLRLISLLIKRRRRKNVKFREYEISSKDKKRERNLLRSAKIL